MAGDIDELIRLFKSQIDENKNRVLPRIVNEEKEEDEKNQIDIKNFDNEHQQNNNVQSHENKENLPLNQDSSPNNKKNLPLIEQLDLSINEDALEKTRAFVANSPNAISGGRNMLRYGEYSPNNPQLRVTAAPYIGLGEYEQRRHLLQQRRRADYLDHISKSENNFKNCLLTGNVRVTRAVQTDLQNIHCPLVQYDTYTPEKELNPYISSSVMQNSRNLSPYRADQRLPTSQNALLKPEMDKPKSILSNRRTGSPRERLLSDLKHSYSPSFMDGFSYQDRSEELERERIKRENYQRELRLQIEEKRHFQVMREEQERREQELENKRLEQQLLRMQEEQAIEEQRRCRRDEQMRRHSEDLLRRKHELQSRLRRHTDSESSVSSLRNTNVASKTLSHYSPPVSRRNPYSFNIPSTSVFADSMSSSSRYNPNRFDSYYRKDALNRMDSLNTYDTHRRYNAFSRFDSLSRIDSLNRQDTLNRIESLNIQDSLSNVQRRHSATQQDLSLIRRSPKLQRRSSSSRFEDTLPIPVLKAHSPVAKELKNSVPFNSSRSDAVRKLEDKWQIPAVQKNIINHGDPLRDGQGRSILTQLGAIRMQLQQEQLRMDEILRNRDFTQSKAVDFH